MSQENKKQGSLVKPQQSKAEFQSPPQKKLKPPQPSAKLPAPSSIVVMDSCSTGAVKKHR